MRYRSVRALDLLESGTLGHQIFYQSIFPLTAWLFPLCFIIVYGRSVSILCIMTLATLAHPRITFLDVLRFASCLSTNMLGIHDRPDIFDTRIRQSLAVARTSSNPKNGGVCARFFFTLRVECFKIFLCNYRP